jgi:arylformamidase
LTLYDISPLVDESIAVWPGDTPYSSRDLLRLEQGDSVHLSTLTLSCHTGAHADAPGHFVEGAPGIDAADLEVYLGPCRLVEVRPADRRVRPADLGHLDLADTPRLLLRTGRDGERTRTRFPDAFTSLTEELVEWLGRRGVRLIGLDSPSVDEFDSKDLPCHKGLFRHGIAILEGLCLDGVPEGAYELVALPLRLAGRDASPVRAVLRSEDA